MTFSTEQQAPGIKILCAHGSSPNQTIGSLKILQNLIGPLEMVQDSKGHWYCSCGYSTEGREFFNDPAAN